MIMLEFKEDALMKAWDELKEVKSGLKHAKHSLCNLEDFMYELYEAQGTEEEYEDKDDEPMVEYRRRRGMKSGMRSSHGMPAYRNEVHYSGRYSY